MCPAEMFDTWSLEPTKSGHRVRAFGDCRMDWRAKSYIRTLARPKRFELLTPDS
jgi:hypothetical protein